MPPPKHDPAPGRKEFAITIALLFLVVCMVGMERFKLDTELVRLNALLEGQAMEHEAEVAKLKAQVDGTLDHFNDKAKATGADPVA